MPRNRYTCTVLFSVTFLELICWVPDCSGAHGKFAYKLLKDLFANYSSALRPVEDTDQALNVTLQVTLSQIIDMDERNQILTAYLWIRQVWVDAYLAWDKEAYDGIDSIRIPSSYVWRPDIVLYNKDARCQAGNVYSAPSLLLCNARSINNKTATLHACLTEQNMDLARVTETWVQEDEQFSGSMETNVVIRHDGQIMWDSPAITKSSCKVDVSYFPFDGQQCRLTFGSWTYNGNQIDLLNKQDTGDLTDFVENVEWEVLGMPARRNVIVYGCCSDPYPDITYTLVLQRRASFYIFNLLLPCIMISFLAPLGFYLPADSGEKVSLGVTVLLALTVFQLLVAESMPPSENVPLIGKYYIATMTLITASTALTIFIMNIHHCGPGARPLPRWARKLILQHMARIFFVYEVGESCQSPRPEPDSLPPGQVANGGGPRGQTKGPVKGTSPLQEGLGPQPDWHEGSKYVDLELGGGEGRAAPSCAKSRCLCHHSSILRNVEYIANCFRDQKAAQKRTGEWKKVAKVMDRFFMWVFFAMVFIMSVLIMGQAT